MKTLTMPAKYVQWFLLLTVALLLTVCHPVQIARQNTAFYPYYFERIRVEMIKVQYKTVPGVTVEHFPRKVPDSLVYRADFVLKFYPDEIVWQKPVLLLVTTQGRQQEFWFNRQAKALSNAGERFFEFVFKTPLKAPRATFTLATPLKSENDSLIYEPDFENPFRSKHFELPQKIHESLIF